MKKSLNDISKDRRYALLLGLFVLLGLGMLWIWPRMGLSADSASNVSQANLAGPAIYTVDRCPSNYQKTVYQSGDIVYLQGTGFQPWEPIYWDIYGMPSSCDANKRIAHSRMTAGWNGSFCIYCYTVAGDDCGQYKVVVNGAYVTYYTVPGSGGPTATSTGTPTVTRTPTATYVPTPYTFVGYVYEEESATSAQLAAPLPLPNVAVELYLGIGHEWRLVGKTRTASTGWFALSYTTDMESPRFRVVEVDPPGYESVRAEKPPLFAFLIDANTIEFRMPYARDPGVMYFYDRKAAPTETPTSTPTVTGTPPTPTVTPTEIPTSDIVTRVLQQGLDGYTGVEDTYISSWYLYQNYSQSNMMSIRSGDKMAPLLRFDLSFIPSNSYVFSAKLSLYAASAGPHAMRAESFRVYRPWVLREVNWIEASKGYKWAEWGANRLGGDRAAQPSDGQELTDVGRWYDFDITEMAQDWVAYSGGNQGVILKGSGDTAVQWNFYASEYWQAEFRPKLTITYAVAGPTPTYTPTRRPTATPTDTATPTATFIAPFGN